MTIEHKIVVGLSDIKAVIFECRQCRTRISMAPDKIAVPPRCAKTTCDSPAWIVGRPAGMTSDYDGSTSAHLNFVSAIGHIREHNGAAFRILLEFEDEPRPPAPTAR
jgi:hypothetical protein